MTCPDYHYIGTINPWGKPEGIGRMVFANNSVHEGAFYNGVPQGFGRCIDPNGNFFEGIYKMGDRAGTGVLTFSDGHQLKGIFKQGGFEAVSEGELQTMQKKSSMQVINPDA